jgi:hypothetical protein
MKITSKPKKLQVIPEGAGRCQEGFVPFVPVSGPFQGMPK